MCSQSLMSPNFLLITSIFINTTTSTHPWSFEEGWRNLHRGDRGRHCLLRDHWNWIRWSEAAVISPECHTGDSLFRNWTLLCLSHQRAKLIPRVLIPTAELLQMWLTQQSHFKINDECVSKYSLSILMTYFSYQQLVKSTLTPCMNCPNLLSLFLLLSQIEFLLE